VREGDSENAVRSGHCGGFRLKSALVGEILDSGSSHSGRDSGRDVQYLAGHRHEFGTLTFKPLSGSGVKVFFFHLCDVPRYKRKQGE